MVKEVKYRIVLSKQAEKDLQLIRKSPYSKKTLALLRLIEADPYQTPPTFERLQGDLQGALSRRINIQHRLVYQVIEEMKIIKILSFWSHYERL
jgi:Txe/YoeB family toxin of toxin-antitoxin system